MSKLGAARRDLRRELIRRRNFRADHVPRVAVPVPLGSASVATAFHFPGMPLTEIRQLPDPAGGDVLRDDRLDHGQRLLHCLRPLAGT